MIKKLLFLLFFSLTTMAQTNLVPNGDFETWSLSSQPDNWYRDFNGFVSESTTSQNGSLSISMKIASGTSNFINSEYFSAEANKTYLVTLYHKVALGSFLSIDLSLYDKPGTFKSEIIKKTDATFSNSEWRKIEFEYTPTVTEDVEVDVWVTGDLNAEILVDNISMVDIATIQRYTVIPDLNFENKLIALGIDSGVADGKVLTNSINKLTDLNVSSSSITDLKGIQDFVSLKSLYCQQNNIISLDLTQNIDLTYLNASTNQLNNLEISKNLGLSTLYCNKNQLTTLNLSENIELKKIICSDNLLSNLNVTNNVLLTDLNCGNNKLSDLDVTQNIVLINLYCHFNQIASLNVTKNIDLKWLMCHFNELTAIDVSQNTKLDLLDCLNNKITSLDVSANPLITELACENNQLIYLNLKNGANQILDLTYSNFTNNPNLTCIQVDDVTYSNENWSSVKDVTALYNLDCRPYTLIPDSNFENKLIDLGIDQDGQNGKVLTSSINTITYLDVSSSNISDMTGIQDFTALTYLDCNINNIENIDLINNKFLTKLALYDNHLSSLDITKNIELLNFECSTNQISSIDLSQNTKLFHLGIENNQLSNLDIAANTGLQTLYCSGNNLTSLDLENQTMLLNLDCGFNKISLLDLSQNTALEGLYCYNMELTALDLSQNVHLKTLNCFSNQITSLDLSQNKELNLVFIEFNPITSLNLQNGNNTNFIISSTTGKTTGLYCSFLNNEKLTCIKVDDVNFSNTNWANIKDATATFNIDCTPYTLIPDANFEDKLIALEIDKDGKNGKVATASIMQITFLDVADSNISDLTGLQDFASLVYFFCDRNRITTVDFSKNLMLENISVQDNNLTSIDVSKNTKLHVLECSQNQIGSIDVSQNTNLLELGLNFNKLTELDLTNNNLTGLHCRGNFLTSINLATQTNLTLLECGLNKTVSLNLSANKKLEELYCEFMELTNLDLSENKELMILNAYGNQLTSLDVSQNPKLKALYIEFNPLKTLNLQNGNNENFVLANPTNKNSQTVVYTSFLNNPNLSCIQVDNVTYSNAKWVNIKDATASYSATCSNLGIEDSVFDKTTIYPNPTKEELHINNVVLEKLTVYDALGKAVKTISFDTASNSNIIDLSVLSKGIYYLYLESEGAVTAKKIVVE